LSASIWKALGSIPNTTKQNKKAFRKFSIMKIQSDTTKGKHRFIFSINLIAL
jgi:hypothetical protein